MLRALGVLFVLIVVAELVLRFGVGLGDPPLYQPDGEIGYLMKPGVYHPLGNTVSINSTHQRSPELAVPKPAGEYRVLVIGDSVVFGGSPTDDAELATTLLAARLRQPAGGPARAVSVANISAGSWGPCNQRAYVRRFGTFDADVAVLVFNSLDFGAVVRPIPDPWAMPEHAPVLALEEAFKRGVLKVAPSLAPHPVAPWDELNPTPENAEASRNAVCDLVALLRSKGVKVAAVQHLRRSELLGQPLKGYASLKNVLEAFGVPIVETGPAFKAAIDAGDEPYRDDIHPNAAGQKVLTDVLERAASAAK